jgi:hypothetical protein
MDLDPRLAVGLARPDFEPARDSLKSASKLHSNAPQPVSNASKPVSNAQNSFLMPQNLFLESNLKPKRKKLTLRDFIT